MSPVLRIPYVVGQWVRGERFYGRAAQIEEILDGPRNWIWLLGTRRLGKTSLLRQIEHVTASSRDRGYFPLFWDLQGADEPEELHQNFQDSLVDAEERLEEIGIAYGDVEAEDLFDSIGRIRRQLRPKNLRLLLLCDEVESLIQLNRKAPSLLRKLRRAFQSHDDIRSVLASTIRLWELAEQKDDTSPFLHGFTPPLYIHTLTDDEARSLICQSQLEAEAQPQLSGEAVESIRSRCDNHPYLIQLVCKRYLEMDDLEEAIEQVASDRMVSYFFSVDFEMLPETDQGVIHCLSELSAATSDSITENLSYERGRLVDSLHRLENLGFVRRNEARRFELANYFFRRWLRDLDTDEPSTSLGAESPSPPAISHEDETRTHDRALGSIEHRYDLLQQIGEGATGIVYKAFDRLLRAQIAVKVLRPEFARNEMAFERFRQEILLSRDIAHPNILRTYSLGNFDGKIYLTMQWVAGITLADKLDKERLPLKMTREIGARLASALHAAHSKNVLHRDIKPANILIDEEGEPYLTDFGVARLLGKRGITESGIFLGTPNYASPEQAKLLPLDGRSDLYSLGVVLFEMATGRRPFQGDDAKDVLELHRSAEPPNPRELEPAIPDSYARIILRCLRKDPDERYPSAGALREALDSVEL